MAYKIEIIQTKKAVVYIKAPSKFRVLDFVYNFIRNINNINQLVFKSAEYRVGHITEYIGEGVEPKGVEFIEIKTRRGTRWKD